MSHISPVQRALESFLSDRVVEIGSSGIRKAFDLAQQMSEVISLGLGEPDFDTPAHIKEAGQKAIRDGFNRYTQNAGLMELRVAIAEKVKKENGIIADPETEIIVTVGGINAIHLAILTLVNPGDEVLIPDPFFVAFEPCVIMAGGRAVHVPLREEEGFKMQASAVKSRITKSSKMLILNTPHNPTGSVLAKKELRELAKVVAKHGLFVLADEVYEKLIYDDQPHLSIGSFPDIAEYVVTVNSFSKSYAMCGWRIGYAVANRKIVEQMVKLQQFNSVHAPTVAQKMAVAALTGPQDELRAMTAEYDIRRRYLVERLNRIPGFSCLMPQGTFYSFPNVRKLGMSSADLFHLLLTEGKVATVPGSALGRFGEGYLRMSFTVSVEKLAKACDRMEEVIRQRFELP